ncbi:hypothetical protein V5799_015876 [Amblyomma americanum]|uniref:Uncharacterized protein n=1 Tax=Amblyomma americanum TaxID=6943 RepID=A0AAQ4F7D0_AMBAM
MEFENCILHRQELTLREFIAWCEHKSSLAKKVAVCYRFVLKKSKRHLSNSRIAKGLQKFQECILNENGGSDMEDGSETGIDGDRTMPPRESTESDEDTMDDSGTMHDPDEESEGSPDRHPDEDSPSGKEDEDDRKSPNKAIWTYPLHDQSYYYPRREKGLGNGTVLPANQTAGPTVSQTTGDEFDQLPVTKPPAASGR